MGQKNAGNARSKKMPQKNSRWKKLSCWKIESICSGRNIFWESTWNDRNCSETDVLSLLSTNDDVTVELGITSAFLTSDRKKIGQNDRKANSSTEKWPTDPSRSTKRELPDEPSGRYFDQFRSLIGKIERFGLWVRIRVPWSGDKSYRGHNTWRGWRRRNQRLNLNRLRKDKINIRLPSGLFLDQDQL